MVAPVNLIPLVCARCQNPIPSTPDEVAWVCSQCGQGLLLSEESGTVPLEIHYSASLPQNEKGRPYWVASGKVNLARQTYSGDRGREAQIFWATSRSFFIPAFECTLEEMVQTGQECLNRPPVLQDGKPVSFLPVVLLPHDMQAYADFVVMSVEASRSDQLKELQFKLELDPPVLWIL